MRYLLVVLSMLLFPLTPAVAQVSVGIGLPNVMATRNHHLLLSGISTRGGINIAEAARANAYLEGREYVVPEDVREVAVAVGSHRLICRPEQESINKEELLSAILGSIPVPLV